MPKKRGTNKKDTQRLLPVIHIFCEGAKTEPLYINGYVNKEHPNLRRLKLIDVKKTNKNTPVQLVKEAKKLKRNSDIPEHDSIWVVYDRESPAKYDNCLHAQAFAQAKANDIKVAISNVCFELWIFLHVCDKFNASYLSYDDLLKNSRLKNGLKKLGIKDYEKADAKIFEAISEKISTARTRAKAMNQATLDSSEFDIDKPYLLNPFTTVGDLLDAIDDIASKA